MEDDFLEVWPIEWNSQRGKRVFPYDAFVSHAGGDRSAEFVEHLRSLGATVWHDGSQVMGDAQWVSRLVYGLMKSRYVILVVEAGHDILERDWVIAEWQSALEAERLSGVQRLLIAKWTEDVRIPSALSQQPQYIIDRHTADLAQLVIAGNTLPSTVIAGRNLPSVPKARDALSEILDSLTRLVIPRDWHSANWELIDLTHRALSAVETDRYAESMALYELWLLSQDTQSVNELDLEPLLPVVNGLVVLALVGQTTDNCANACFMLRALAQRGCKSAGDALLHIVRTTENGELLALVVDWFLADNENLPALARDDYTRVLLILPSGKRSLADRLFALAPPEADPAKLRHYVVRTTDRHFEKLSPSHRRIQAAARFEHLLEAAEYMWEWEVFFRGVAADARLDTPIIHANAPVRESEVATFITLAERFADEYTQKPTPKMWILEYEVALLRPLAIACAIQRFDDKPIRAYRKVLQCLEAPVRQDMSLLEQARIDLRVSEDEEYISLLHREMQSRLQAIALYRQGPSWEEKENGYIGVDLLVGQSRSDLVMAVNELERERILRFRFLSGPKNADIAAIWERWAGVDLL